MSRKKPPQRQTNQKPAQARSGVHTHWVWTALIAGLLFGGMSGYFIGQAVPAGENGLVVDRYGRGPAHPHYGHNHP